MFWKVCSEDGGGGMHADLLLEGCVLIRLVRRLTGALGCALHPQPPFPSFICRDSWGTESCAWLWGLLRAVFLGETRVPLLTVLFFVSGCLGSNLATCIGLCGMDVRNLKLPCSLCHVRVQ